MTVRLVGSCGCCQCPESWGKIGLHIPIPRKKSTCNLLHHCKVEKPYFNHLYLNIHSCECVILLWTLNTDAVGRCLFSVDQRVVKNPPSTWPWAPFVFLVLPVLHLPHPTHNKTLHSKPYSSTKSLFWSLPSFLQYEASCSWNLHCFGKALSAITQFGHLGCVPWWNVGMGGSLNVQTVDPQLLSGDLGLVKNTGES